MAETGKYTLYDFQRIGVDFLVLDPQDPNFPNDVNGVAIGRANKLLADDMGLGKTVQVIAAMDRVEASHVVVVCPAQVKIHWAREILKFSKRHHNITILRTGKCKIPPSANVIIVNYELVLRDKIYRQLVERGKGRKYSAIVLDEAHFLKAMTAKRTKRIFGKGSFIENSDYRWALTGTPVLNRPAELYPMLYAMAKPCIDPHISWRAYAEYFCAARVERKCYKCGALWGVADTACPSCGSSNSVVSGLNTKGSSHASELAERIKPFMLRRKKEDVLDQLPDKIETSIELNVRPPSDVDDTPIATVRRDLALAKVPDAIEFCKNLLEETDKIVIFAHHRDAIEQMAQGLLSLGSVILYGGMSADEKQKSIDSFVNSPSTRAIVAQTIAGGTGVNGLQGASNTVVFLEPDWSPGIMEQAIDRLRRIGQKRNVFVYYLVVPDSLDDHMRETLDAKRRIIDKIVKASEGVYIMSDNLSAISDALRDISTAFGKLADALGGEENSSKKPTSKPAKKKAEAPAEPAPPAAPSAPKLTEEDLRKAVGAFITTPGTDQNDNKRIINEVIWPQFNATSWTEVPQDKYADAIAAIEKGPGAYTAPTPADPLAGV